MKYIKLFESFEEEDIDIDDIKDIFLTISDYGLGVDEAFIAHLASMGGKDMIDDHNQLDMTNTKRGIIIKLLTKRLAHENSKFEFSEEFFEELEFSIEHFESKYGCKLSNIYLSKTKSFWVSDLDNLKKYSKDITPAALTWLSGIQIAFVLNDSVDN